MSKRVSVILLSYNKDYLVPQAINSVLNQTYENFELIIVENSNNKRARQVVKNFSDTRIRYFEENLTSSFRKSFNVEPWLRNKYYPKARGDYLVFLADDDLLLQNCLSESVSFLEKNRANVIYFGQYIQYLNSGKQYFDSMVREPSILLRKGKDNPRELLDGGQVIFKTKLLKKLPQPFFPTEFSVEEICDRLFLEKLSALESFQPIRKILGVKRVTKISTHPLKRPIKYKLYALLTKFFPEFLRIYLGERTKKRRRMSVEEKHQLELVINNLNL